MRCIPIRNSGVINEIFWLRAAACISVTLGHAIYNGFSLYTEPTVYHLGIYILNMSIFFGVPVFVFISEFLIANNYLIKVPKGFIKKRVKILLLPYLFMNIVYAFLYLETWSLNAFIIRLIDNIFLGKSSVYFILVIFQFYYLHILFSKYLNRISGKIIIPLAFLINFIYLAIFNFTDPPNNSIGNYLWGPGYWLPFVGWIFYFALGFYCGKYYSSVLNVLRYKWLLIMPVLTLGILLIMNKFFQLDYNSKRVDMLLYSPSIIFFIVYISSKVKRLPKIVMQISNYSFSIFLLNEFFLILIKTLGAPSFLNIITYSFSAFLLTMYLCIITAFLFNKFRFGKYLVGRVMSFKAIDIPKEKHKELPKGYQYEA